MRKEIEICLGSSCFSRGNKKTVHLIKDYIKNHQLEDKIYFHGNHCYGNCENGPILKIDSKEYQNVSPDNIIFLLDSIFMKD
ncbi:MAG: (2Fe-2S) ferredoxin domain-containing protein [Bacteroidales bacterium]|nr:(2Fe-2S) ferredoxin domain-containing protein [Bacteroidales bacterium]